MEANELRIGNWIKTPGQLLKVTSISDFMICSNNWGFDNFEDIEGIPLTPEILEKLDIKKINQTFFDRVQFGNECYYDISELRLIYKNKSFYHAITGQDIKIKYLHQFQNLYFALTGKELEIELWKTSKTS